MIHLREVDKKKRDKVENSISKLLATYPNSILAEVDDDQIESLKDQGIRLDVQEGARMIRFKTIEFDTSEKAPTPPSALTLKASEIKKEEKNYFVIQFIGPPIPEWKEKISALGGKLHEYIPENAFLAEMTPQIKEEVLKLPFVNYVDLYHPFYKVSPLLMGRREKISPQELHTLSVKTEAFRVKPEGNLNILLHDPNDMELISKEVEDLGGSIISKGKNILRVSLDPSEIEKVAKMTGVKYIEPIVLPKLVNDVVASIIGVQPVWNDHGLDGEGQIIAVADSGLDTGINDDSMHDDFKGRIVNIHSWPIPAGLRQYLNNTSLDDGDADKGDGHGTHVTGSVLGNGAKSGGAIKGMAPNATLIFQAIEQWADWKPNTGYRKGYYLLGIPDDLNDLFLQAYNEGARIQTNSWGGAEDDQGNDIHGQYTANSQQIDDFMWQHKDTVILFAAGNDGKDNNKDGIIDTDSLLVQACAKNCITVGASENNRPPGSSPPPGYDIPWATKEWAKKFPVEPIKNDHVSDNPEGMAAFSSRGPTDDGRIKPDVVAPGTNILSVRSSVATEVLWGELPANDPNSPFYWYSGGTSMSTPIIAGTVALIRQYLQKVCLHANPTGALLKAILIHGAVPMAGQYNPPEVGAVPDNNQGWGRVNLKNSLFPDHPVNWKFEDNPADTIVTSDYRDLSLRVVDSTVPLRATLVWTDYPSGLQTGGGLVNVLRLSIISPDGTILQGAPPNNNVQQVVINNPQPGDYKVRVDAINITMEGQDFALVYSGGTDIQEV